MGNSLAGRPRRRATDQVRREEPYCHLCGNPVDLTLDRHRHPFGSVVDELHPRSMGGSTTDRTNLRHAHRACNGYRGDRPITDDLRAGLHAYLAAKHPPKPPQRPTDGPRRTW